MSAVPFVPPFDPTKLAFGPKDGKGKFVSTTINGALVKFCLGSKEAPLRAPFGISEPFQGETTQRRTMDLELSDPALLAVVRGAAGAAGAGDGDEEGAGRLCDGQT